MRFHDDGGLAGARRQPAGRRLEVVARDVRQVRTGHEAPGAFARRGREGPRRERRAEERPGDLPPAARDHDLAVRGAHGAPSPVGPEIPRVDEALAEAVGERQGPIEGNQLGAPVDEHAVRPLAGDRDGRQLGPRLVRLAHEHVPEADRHPRRGRAAPRAVVGRGEEQGAELGREGVTAEREELEQDDAGIVRPEAAEDAIPAVGQVPRLRRVAVGTRERARRLVRRHEGRKLHDLRVAQVERRNGPAALDEDDGLAGPSERAREPGRALEVAEPEQMLAVEEDRAGTHGASGSLRPTS